MGSAMVERRIETNIEINAPTVRIWALLTDFAWILGNLCFKCTESTTWVVSLSASVSVGRRY
jgi:hypothetical protein